MPTGGAGRPCPNIFLENLMEHTDFSKILQTFLPIIIFIFWAMFSNAGKKKKKRNYEAPQKRKTDPLSDHSFDQEVAPYHKAPDREESRATPNPVVVTSPDSSRSHISQKPAITGHLPQHQPAIPVSMPSDLQVHIFSAPGASRQSPIQDYGRHSPEELQKLVVWSEILGRPVAMRDQD